jgi:hypothetical protein
LLRGVSYVTLKFVYGWFGAQAAGGCRCLSERNPCETKNVTFIEFASDLEESRIKVRGDGLEFLLPNSTWTICKPHTKAQSNDI